MSNALAIASVTAVLKDLLDNAIIDHSLNTAVGDRIEVTSMPPDRISTGSPEKAQLNIFLYNIVPNQGWRNVGLPSHGREGERLTNPPLALDLYYLLSAYVKQDFDAEILLGYAMQTLHEMPVLTRDAIRKALRSPSPLTGDALPPAVGDLSASDLAEQVELIKITPHQVNSEEISKLWSAFQANYRPSVAYHISVVLIEGRHSTMSALPVRQRRFHSYPISQPVIEQVRAEEGINQPIVTGSTLVIYGRQLLGDITKIRIGEIMITPAPENISDTKISLLVPPDLKAGVQGLQVVHGISMGTSSEFRPGAESNAAAFILRPTITASVSNVTSTISNGTIFSADITVSFNPIIGKVQRAILLLNEFNPPDDRSARSYSFHAPIRQQDDDSMVIQITGVEAGDYLVRMQVDGAQSPLLVDTDPVSPTFNQYVNPRVTIA